MNDGSVIEERQPHMRGGAQEPLTRQDVIDKFALNAEARWMGQSAERRDVEDVGGAVRWPYRPSALRT